VDKETKMAVIVPTPKPKTLLAAIKQAIDEKKIDTWEYDNDGDFTHRPEQWYKQAWLRPNVQQGVLLFGLIGKKDVKMTKPIYGVYHGRFIEMLLTHFDTEFSTTSATAQADTVDSFK
jgi:hypothetical protein